MAQLIYTTQNGKTVSLPLKADTGFTARLEWFSPLAGKGEQELRAELAGMSLPQLASEGDHIIYGEPNGPLVIAVIRPHKISSPKRVDPKQSSQDRSQYLDLRRSAMLIQRCRREWIVVADDVQRIWVDKRPVLLLKILKHGMEIQLGDLALTFRETDKETVDQALLKNLQSKKCPYCQSPFEVGEEVIRCPACGTLQHAECWDAYRGRCTGPAGCLYGVKAPGTQKTLGSDT